MLGRLSANVATFPDLGCLIIDVGQVLVKSLGQDTSQWDYFEDCEEEILRILPREGIGT